MIGVDYTEMVCIREETGGVWGKRVQTEDRDVAVTHGMTVVEGKSAHIHNNRVIEESRDGGGGAELVVNEGCVAL